MRRSPTALAAVPLLVSAMTLIVTEAALSGDTAIHWSLSGDPDGFASPRTAWAVTGGVATAAALVAAAAGRLRSRAGAVPTGRPADPVGTIALGVSMLFAGLSVLVTVANLGDGEPRLSPLAVVATLAICLLVVAAVAGPSTTSGRLEMSPSSSNPSEILWQGTCRSRFAIPTFLVFVAAGAVVAVLVDVVPGVVIAVAGLFVLALVEIRVELTAEALRIRYSGPLRWPSQSIRHADVATTEAIDVDPKRYGGWGYRGSLRLFRRAALNLRKGPGLRLELHDGRVFVVTVDDAATAADRMRPLLTAPAARSE